MPRNGEVGENWWGDEQRRVSLHGDRIRRRRGHAGASSQEPRWGPRETEQLCQALSRSRVS